MGEAFCTFASWLLDAPVQSASCKQLFKDFAQYSTKARIRLSHNKMEILTLIKHDMKIVHEINNARRLGDCKHASWKNTHCNRNISPIEHPKVSDGTKNKKNKSKKGGAKYNNSNDEVHVVEMEQEREDDILDSSEDDNNEYISLDKVEEDLEKTAEAAVLAKMDMATTVLSFKVQQLLAAVQSPLPDDDEFYETNSEGNGEGGARQQQNLNNNATNEESNDDEMASEPLDFAKVAREEEKRKRDMEPPAAGTRHLPRRGGEDGSRGGSVSGSSRGRGVSGSASKASGRGGAGRGRGSGGGGGGQRGTNHKNKNSNEEDHCERCDSNSLVPLSEGENQANYLQEGKKYFSTKNYMQKDKYGPHQFVYKDIPLPELMSAFNK